MCLHDKSRRGRFLDAHRVVNGGIGLDDELITNLELLVGIGEDRWLPDGEASWVTIPLVIRLGDVAEQVEFLGWVVDVDVGACGLEGAGKLVTAVLNTPEPMDLIYILVTNLLFVGNEVCSHISLPSKTMPISLRSP